MSKSYLPTRESELLTWVTAFFTLVESGPAEYGLTVEQAADLSAALSAFSAAYQTAKDALVVLVRGLVKVCQAWPAMTDDKRAALGITVPDTDPSPVPAPEFAPQSTSPRSPAHARSPTACRARPCSATSASRSPAACATGPSKATTRGWIPK